MIGGEPQCSAVIGRSLIRQNFIYVNESGVDQAATIPTLHEWMDLVQNLHATLKPNL